VILRYLDQALARARYEQLDDGSWSAHVPQLRGVIGIGPSLERCRANLAEVVEEWVLVRVARTLPIPRLGGVTIRVRKAS